MTFFDSRYIKINKILLVCIGQWPYQKMRDRVLRGIIVVIAIVSSEFVMVAKFFTSGVTLNLIAELLPFAIICIVLLIKYTTYWVNELHVRELLERIESDWCELRNDTDIDILARAAEEGRLFIILNILFVYVSAAIFLLSTFYPLLLDVIVPLNQSRPLQLPFNLEYFVDQQTYFYPIFLHVCVVCAAGLITLMAADMLCVVYLQHASGMFRVAGSKLEHAFDEEHDVCPIAADIEASKKIALAVRCHVKAMTFTAKVNECYQWPHFLALVFGIISISVSLFCAAMFIGRWKEMILSMISVLGQTGYLFIEVYPAQILIDSSSQILDKAYAGKWYRASPSTQKLLLLTMQKSLVPSTLVVAKMFHISLIFYTKVIQMSVSYFTALCSVS